jgi:hypothetical protein
VFKDGLEPLFNPIFHPLTLPAGFPLETPFLAYYLLYFYLKEDKMKLIHKLLIFLVFVSISTFVFGSSANAFGRHGGGGGIHDPAYLESHNHHHNDLGYDQPGSNDSNSGDNGWGEDHNGPNFGGEDHNGPNLGGDGHNFLGGDNEFAALFSESSNSDLGTDGDDNFITPNGPTNPTTAPEPLTVFTMLLGGMGLAGRFMKKRS